MDIRFDFLTTSFHLAIEIYFINYNKITINTIAKIYINHIYTRCRVKKTEMFSLLYEPLVIFHESLFILMLIPYVSLFTIVLIFCLYASVFACKGIKKFIFAFSFPDFYFLPPYVSLFFLWTFVFYLNPPFITYQSSIIFSLVPIFFKYMYFNETADTIQQYPF